MARAEIIEQLQNRILTLQGDQRTGEQNTSIGLGAIESAFPTKTFSNAAIHELISSSYEDASCTNAFISVVLGKLMREKGTCIWISNKRKIFPPALKSFGIDPERILFVDAWKTKDILWTIEESLKCSAITAVVGEMDQINFNDSRRLQLAVEKSRVTGFIHRRQPKVIDPLACVTRWKIRSAPSNLPEGMPGVGFPRWKVELLKVRNGKPGKWILQWSPRGLEYISEEIRTKIHERKSA
jgi:protein ImuA